MTIKELEEKNIQLEDFYLEIINGTTDLSTLNQDKKQEQQLPREVVFRNIIDDLFGLKDEQAQAQTASVETTQNNKKTNIFAKIFKKFGKKQ